mmetsp:Transcript_22291/g.35645  ORF Transcript_22291/g.35645 Transcript_22291/m.35645 type:complete len:120 (-) Transcript_22291:491-850(-)
MKTDDGGESARLREFRVIRNFPSLLDSKVMGFPRTREVILEDKNIQAGARRRAVEKRQTRMMIPKKKVVVSKHRPSFNFVYTYCVFLVCLCSIGISSIQRKNVLVRTSNPVKTAEYGKY